MDLIIGGAFQGKLEHAVKTYGLSESDIYECKEDCEPDFSKRCIYHYERYVFWCRENGKTPVTSFDDDKIVIMNDIFCGVVPIEPKIRAWREDAGRAMAALAGNAKTVTRLFCGIPQRIK